KEKRIHLVAQIFRVALKARRNKSNSAIERQRVYQRGAPDTRQPAYIVDQRVIKGLTTAEVIAKSLIRRNSSTENRLAVKTGIDGHELPETLHHQSGCRHQHNGECDLRHCQASSQSVMSGDRVLRSRLQRLCQVYSGKLKCGRKSEHQAGENPQGSREE